MPPRPWLHHVALTVSDLDRSANWYSRLLDIRDLTHLDGPSWRRVLLRSGELTLSLTQHAATDQEDRFDETRVGLDHVAIGCHERAELEAWITHLDAIGVPHGAITEAPHAHLVTCQDPDGIAVEFFWLASP